MAEARGLPGGIVLESQEWVAFHAPGSWTLGTMALLSRRHVSRVGELNDREADTLGTLLRDLAGAASASRKSTQVYVNQWAHHGGVATHVHFLLQPIDSDLMEAYPGLLGPALQAEVLTAGSSPSARDVVEAAALARRFLEGIATS